MLSILKKGPSANKVPAEKVQATYGRYRIQALLSVFLGYLAYYIVRNNFTLSTPYLKEQLDLSATQIGLLSSCMLIAYGISKGIMSSLADKASPKVFMACGLVLCAIVNVGLGFSTAFWIFAALVVLNGLFQGMGVGPSFITIANWFPRRERGRVGAFWNISHNVGGGIVAPIVGAAFAILGTEHWQSASYIVPACVAVVFAISVLALIFICLIGYWKSESLLMVTVFAAIVGCLIYVPQFLASVQTMEIVPSFAVGSAVGLRGFMSYIFGASLGTSLFGVMVDKMGWHGGFYLLMGGIVCCILFCYLSHRGALELEQQRKNTQQQEAELALADAR
ncbi:MFS transporter [Klebsiella grimontii]|uniref:MFS transporter n=1 Tax=Klebsiella grimontii TaxID=2058152 RepID=UPI0012B779CB|nr:MFS transporter [Klebsiella grimontii]